MLTACGIETAYRYYPLLVLHRDVATVLTACGIETIELKIQLYLVLIVATVLTACGIETYADRPYPVCVAAKLQQCLPLAVLKHKPIDLPSRVCDEVATVLTACGIETQHINTIITLKTIVVATVLTACGIETDDKEHHSS